LAFLGAKVLRTVKRGGKYSRFPGIRQSITTEKNVGLDLAVIYFPVPGALITDLQQAVFRIVPLAAGRALQIPAPGRAFPIVVFGNSEGRAATARHEEELEG
jgi:hypothetical protein